MSCRGRGHLAADTAEAFLDQLLQGPACAVTGQHGKVMDVDVRVLMGIGNLGVINLAEPVVSGNGAGIVQDQTAHGIGNRRIFLNAPVFLVNVAVDDLLVVKDRRLHVPHLLAVLTVQDVCLRYVGVTGGLENVLNAVLDILHLYNAILYLALKLGSDTQGQKVDDIIGVLLLRRLECLLDRGTNLLKIKIP